MVTEPEQGKTRPSSVRGCLSATRTIPGEPLEALAAVTATVSTRYGDPHTQDLATDPPAARWLLEDGTMLAATVGGEEPDGTPVTLGWEQPTSDDGRAELVELLEASGPTGREQLT